MTVAGSEECAAEPFCTRVGRITLAEADGRPDRQRDWKKNLCFDLGSRPQLSFSLALNWEEVIAKWNSFWSGRKLIQHPL